MTTKNITADGSLEFPLNNGTHEYTIRAVGTWGGGTLSFYTNKNSTGDIEVLDTTGVAVTATDNKTFNITVGAEGDTTKLVATLSGATSPDLNVSCDGGN